MNISALRVPALAARRRWRVDFRTLQLIARVAQTMVVVLALFALAAVIGTALYGYSHAHRIYEGVTVAGVPVGGLSESEARQRIEAQFEDYRQSEIPLYGADQTFLVSPEEAGLRLDSLQSAQAAYEFGRTGPIWERAGVWIDAAVGGEEIDPVIAVDETRLDQFLVSVADQVTRPAIDATVEVAAGAEPSIVPEMPGIAFDLSTTRARLIDQFSAFGNEAVALELPVIVPEVTADELTGTLDGVKTAVGAPLVLSALDSSWIVSQEQLARIVSVESVGAKVRVDEAALETLVAGIAEQIDRPSKDARLYISDDGEFRVAKGVSAVEVDVASSVKAAAAGLVEGTHRVELDVREVAPQITDEMALEAKAEAEALVAPGIELTWDGGSARLGAGDLMAAMTIEHRPGGENPVVFGFHSGVLTTVLEPAVADLIVPARDAKFRLVDGEITVVQKAKSGQAVDLEGAAVAINDAVLNGEPSVELALTKVKPAFTDSYRSKIKLDDVLGEASTYYGNSSEPRRRNIETAVRLETGWLIPPDGVFSYNEYIGDVTEEQGFVTGFGIVADGAGGVTTAPVIGGGICQVSTTIFQASFWAGLAVEERWTHPYWINTYGEAPSGMKGLDAMVNIDENWSLDLKLRNTTGNWVAVVLRADGERVSAQILGTDPGWEVKVDGPTITNVKAPPTETRYTESSELPAGQEMQVESAQEGFDAAIERTIVKDGQTLDETVLSSTYGASQHTILRGTGS